MFSKRTKRKINNVCVQANADAEPADATIPVSRQTECQLSKGRRAPLIFMISQAARRLTSHTNFSPPLTDALKFRNSILVNYHLLLGELSRHFYYDLN